MTAFLSSLSFAPWMQNLRRIDGTRPSCHSLMNKDKHSSIMKTGFQRRILLSNWSFNGLNHWGRDKIDAILPTTFSNAISWMKMFEFRLKFHWSLFLKVQLTIFQHWFRRWLGAEQATSHYLNQWWPSSTTHICVTRHQWVNSHAGSPSEIFGH